MEEYKRNCPECGEELTYSRLGNLNLANRRNKPCASCSKKEKKTKKNHPEIIQKICEWCQEPFEVTWKYRKQRFCIKQCMYDWRKDQNWTTSICGHCNEEFKHRKKSKRQYCSDYCNKHSDKKLEVLAKAARENNGGGSPEAVKKIKKKLKGRNVGFGAIGNKVNHTKLTKKEMSKIKKQQYKENKEEILAKRDKTYLKKYGMTCGEYFSLEGKKYAEKLGIKNVLQLPENKKKARRKISKGQRQKYEETKREYPDAILEHWLKDVRRNVDIYVPSQKLIIEYYGTYWHADPNKYSPDYYHKVKKMTAEEIWKKDGNREQELIGAGYQVVIEWEK